MGEAKPTRDPIVIERNAFRPNLAFSSPTDARDWFDRESGLWGWTRDAQGIPGGEPAEAVNRYSSWPERIRPQLEAWEKEPDSDNKRDEFAQTVRSHLGEQQGQARLCALDPPALAIAELAKKNRVVAAAALAQVDGLPMNQNLVHQNLLVRIGRAHGTAYLVGLGTETPVALSQMVIDTNAQIASRLNSFENALSILRSNGATAISEFASEHKTLRDQHDSAFKKEETERSESFTALASALRLTQEFYERTMELQGPVSYWDAKAKRHRLWAWILGGVLGIYTVASIAFFFWLFQHPASPLPQQGDSAALTSLFRAGAFAALMTTIIFWVGRILVRMFLSDRHLATDAEERRVMIMTFLALTKNQTVDEKDRALILAALFRAGSDGIVKDEAGPETAAASLLGALLKR